MILTGWTTLATGLLLAAAVTTQPLDLEHVREGRFATGAPPAAANSLKIINWNIERGIHLPDVTEYLQKVSPDIAVLQEVDINTRRSRTDIPESLAQILKLNYAFAPAFEELSQGSSAEAPAIQGQATLSRFPVKASRMIRFKDQSTFWEPRAYLPKWALFQRRHGGRVALVNELDVHGRLWVVYNLHLESRSGGDLQDKQLDETLADMKRYPADTPILLVGDLNTKYHPFAVLHRLQKLGFASCFGDSVMRSHVIVGWFDWIFVHGPVACEEPQMPHNVKGSDHFPLTARITWKP